MKKSVIGAISALSFVGIAQQGVAQEASNIEDTRNTISEWVNIRQDISETTNEWQVQKELIQNRIQMFKDEKESLLLKIEETKQNQTAADEKRRTYSEEEETLRNSTKVIDARISKYEKQVREINKSLPDPLKKKTDKLIANMPLEGAKTSMGASQRIALVVGVLNEIDKFNNMVVVVKDMREVDGARRQVKTMYLGLAQAFYADESGEFAGIGKPTADGWNWESANDLAVEISQAINVADASLKPPVFSNLPISID